MGWAWREGRRRAEEEALSGNGNGENKEKVCGRMAAADALLLPLEVEQIE